MKHLTILSFLLCLTCSVALLCSTSPNTAYAAKKKKKPAANKKDSSVDNEDAPKNPDEITCESEIFFTWRRLKPTTAVDASSKSEQKEKAKDTSDNSLEEFFKKVSEQGADEKQVKDNLTRRLSAERAKAKIQCEERRESESLCVVKKLKMLSVDYKTLDFIARKRLLDTISNDCERNVGICVSTRSGPIKCFQPKPPQKEPEGEEKEAADDKKS